MLNSTLLCFPFHFLRAILPKKPLTSTTAAVFSDSYPSEVLLFTSPENVAFINVTLMYTRVISDGLMSETKQYHIVQNQNIRAAS